LDKNRWNMHRSVAFAARSSQVRQTASDKNAQKDNCKNSM